MVLECTRRHWGFWIFLGGNERLDWGWGSKGIIAKVGGKKNIPFGFFMGREELGRRA